MNSITIESSYQSTNKDMGDNHITAHANQHKYLQKDEPLIETLTPNKTSESSTDLALDWAIKNTDVMNENEWKNYNSHLRKSRRKKDYAEYLISLSNNFIKAKKRRLNNPKTAKKTREKIARELTAYRQTGVPLDGSLYYLNNTEIYDNLDAKQLKKYRQFERNTFEKFFNSSTFKSLNPQCIRAEIHFDENGAIHLQSQNIWYYTDAKNRVSYAKRAILRNTLSKWYGGSEALQNRLDVLCLYHDVTQKHGRQIGSKRADTMYLDYFNQFPEGQVDDASKTNKDGSKRKYKYSSAERNTRLEELWRIEQMSALREIAENTAKSMGINYHVDENYATDGVHLDGAAYIEHKKASQKAQKAMSLANQVKNASQSVSDDLKSTYEAISGEKTEEKSPLELANKIKSKVKAQQKASEDNQAKIKNQEQQIKEQEKNLARLRNENRVIAQNNRKLQEENKSLKDSNSKLEERLKYLQQQVQTAGIVIGTWVRRNWDKLEEHFKKYATNINNANHERLYGGRDGKGDRYLADKYEKEAKEGLISAFDGVQKKELQKSGYFATIVNTSNKSKEDDKTPES
ncbi:hypothetical protein [Limosilactobacillus vaginalis]|uniref:hypothetical protein n=1 Tax=Limosilactobacillus vaginalis TaxID=1633 RepID=UPI0025A41EC2|nr:hypothetical protein [Limosilactobacillus vaginalis]MDM8265352.1 hypothetical protein [Limosilactobacillus vaginalis]